jgi:hypothetical protein
LPSTLLSGAAGGEPGIEGGEYAVESAVEESRSADCKLVGAKGGGRGRRRGRRGEGRKAETVGIGEREGGKGCSMYIDVWNIRVCWWYFYNGDIQSMALSIDWAF